MSPVLPRLRIAVLLALLGPLPACPQATGPGPTKVERHPAVVDDPRAVNATGDLYAADDKRGTPVSPPPPPASPGTGRPDETNGTCRLYAPELTDPELTEWAVFFAASARQRALRADRARRSGRSRYP